MAIKGLQNGFPEHEIANGIMVFYHQCEQVARENIERAKTILALGK